MPELLAELNAFHFLRPLWLLALLPLALLLAALWRPGSSASPWARVCDAHLLPYLLQVQGQRGRGPLWLLGVGWLLAVLALAGPTWTQRELPVLRSLAARVIVLDLSRSMEAADLKPSRIARARYKVADILARSTEGQTGLVVFAGEAFAVAPLTRDAATLNALLAVLEPSLMPVQGSRADLGLRKARELLEQAGISSGEILLIADEADTRAAVVAENFAAAGFPVSVLAVGTEEGAPIPLADGFLKDNSGAIVIPRLDVQALRELARVGAGRFAPISVNDTDLTTLLAGSDQRLAAETERVERETAIWREEGPWLVLILLPLAALAFRRGWLLVVVLYVLPLPPAQAFDWQDLWQRPDQRAARLLEQQEPGKAAAVAADPWLRGTAHYQAEQYEQALADFTAVPGADGFYNQGNALARLGRLEEALTAFEAALAADPDMEDAQHNRAVVEELLKQQQQQQQDSQNGENGENSEQNQQQGQQGQSGQQGESGQPGQPQPSAEQPGQSAAAGQPNDAAQSGTAQDQAEAEAQAGTPADAEQAAAEQTNSDESSPAEPSGPPVAEGGDLDPEEQQALNQWLRRIPDDPGGLLRNKFYYQYQRAGEQHDPAEKEW